MSTTRKTTSRESFEPAIERTKERLRQERETFDQHKTHENRWFFLRLVMGYSSVVLLIAIMIVSSYILSNASTFSNTVVTAAGAALFVDTLGLIISIWKIVFNPGFMTKLAPITQLEKSESKFFDDPNVTPQDKNGLIILSAKYGANNDWMDVAPVLRANIKGGKLQFNVTNSELGSDPIRGVAKKLEITYLFDGRTYSKTLSESERLSIPES